MVRQANSHRHGREPKPPTQRLVGFLDAYVGKVNRRISNSPYLTEIRTYARHESILQDVYKKLEGRFLTLLQSYLFSVPNAVRPRFYDGQSGTRPIQVMFTPPLRARAYSAARRKLSR